MDKQQLYDAIRKYCEQKLFEDFKKLSATDQVKIAADLLKVFGETPEERYRRKIAERKRKVDNFLKDDESE